MFVKSNLDLLFLPKVPQYERRQPEKTVLYRVIQENWLTFRDRAREIDDRGLPKFVEKEFEEYLKCGVLAHGFVRVRCEECGEEKIVGFSCKRRGGICSSCNGRKMSETAALLTDYVIPKVAVRQWVVTVPIFLRYIMARNSIVLSKILGIIIGVITGYYRNKAKKKYRIRGGLTGAISIIQRFGSALNLNVHIHSAFLEGIYKEGSEEFYRVDAPTDADVAKVISTIAKRVNRYLRKQGYLKEQNEVNTDQLDILERENPLLSTCIAASVQQKIGLGKRAGSPVRRLGASAFGKAKPEFKAPLCCSLDYFSIHARTHVEPHRRDLLEKLLRYILRPALAQERLSLTEDGDVLYELKKPYSDGTTSIQFTPMELLEKLVALVPPPRIHLIRYHGILAPHSSKRSCIVPRPADEKDDEPKGLSVHEVSHHHGCRPYRISWAKILKRVFLTDLEHCSQCGGKMKIISAIMDVDVIRRILTHIGVSPDPPKLSPSRFSCFTYE